MGRLILFTFSTLLSLTNSFGQEPSESINKGWMASRATSIFKKIDNGEFFGTTTGYIKIVDGKDTVVLDFQGSQTKLGLIKNQNAGYDDNCTKVYDTQPTSDNMTFDYQSYSSANAVLIRLNGKHYSIGTIPYTIHKKDSRREMPIDGLIYHYWHAGNIEYLTLVVEKPLQLPSVDYLLSSSTKDMEAKKTIKPITVLSGSTLIITMKK